MNNRRHRANQARLLVQTVASLAMAAGIASADAQTSAPIGSASVPNPNDIIVTEVVPEIWTGC